jgi:hypothetical protein
MHRISGQILQLHPRHGLSIAELDAGRTGQNEREPFGRCAGQAGGLKGHECQGCRTPGEEHAETAAALATGLHQFADAKANRRM